MSTNNFHIVKIIQTKAFVLVTIALAIVSLILANMPLFGILGFEYNLIFGLFTTIFTTHYALTIYRHRQKCKNGPSFQGTFLRIWLIGLLALLPAIAIISLNAFRIQNCNFSRGFTFFFFMPFIGSFLACSLASFLASWKRKGWATAFVYILPLLAIAKAGYLALIHPPIFFYDHFFTFYPGTIYDEVREITSTFIIYRLSTLGWGFLILSGVALFSGKRGLLGQETFSWHEALIQQKERCVDGQLTLGKNKEAVLGVSLLFILTIIGLAGIFTYRFDIGYYHNAKSIQKALGGLKETKHFLIYYAQDSMKKNQLERIARDHEFRYYQLAKFFGHETKHKVRSYLFKSSHQKSQLMGADRTMVARPWANEFYIHGNRFPHYVLKHEMAHVFSSDFGSGPLKLSAGYGILFSPGMIEGVAVAADWSEGSLTPHQLSRAMIELKMAPTPAQVLNPFGFFQRASSRSYRIAGSFSRYLIDKYGMAKYKKAYGKLRFQSAYKKSLQTLSDEWLLFLKKKVPLTQYERSLAAYRFRRHRSIFARTCPHEIAKLKRQASRFYNLGSFHRAIKIQNKVCGIEPSPYNFLSLINIQYDAGLYKQAARKTQEMIRDYSVKKRPILNARLMTRYAMLQHKLKNSKLAKEIFKKLSQRWLPLYRKRSVLVQLYAFQHKQQKQLLKYLEKPSNSSSLVSIQKLYFQNQSDPIISYLFSRRLYFLAKYKTAIPILKKVKQSVRAFSLQVETLRMLARSQFAIGQYDQAINSFKKLAQMSKSQGKKEEAIDWAERSAWEKTHYGRAPKTN